MTPLFARTRSASAAVALALSLGAVTVALIIFSWAAVYGLQTPLTSL
jgi:hypothetical protein